MLGEGIVSPVSRSITICSFFQSSAAEAAADNEQPTLRLATHTPRGDATNGKMYALCVGVWVGGWLGFRV